MGVTQSTVARFEAYDSNPTLASIRRYAHAIGALVTHVVTTDEERRRDGGSWIPVRMPTNVVSIPSQNNHTERVPPSRLRRRLTSGKQSWTSTNSSNKSNSRKFA